MPLFHKLSYYSLSMWAFYLIVFLLSFKIPELKGEWTWIDLAKETIRQNSIIPIVAMILFLLDIIGYIFICLYIWKGQTHSPIKIEVSEHKNMDYLTLAISILTPLVSFGFTNSPIRYGLVLLVIYVIFGIIYIRGELYYANSTLILFGIRLYRITGKTVGGHEKNKIMVFSRHKLNKGDAFHYIKITDDVVYARKMNI